jgi:hypothetical protein
LEINDKFLKKDLNEEYVIESLWMNDTSIEKA